MKLKKQSSGANPDIRSFFSLSPAAPSNTTKSKARTTAGSPFGPGSRRSSGAGTPSTVAGTPPSLTPSAVTDSTAGAASPSPAPRGTAAAAAPGIAGRSSTKRVAASPLTPARARKTPPPRPTPPPEKEVVCLTESPVSAGARARGSGGGGGGGSSIVDLRARSAISPAQSGTAATATSSRPGNLGGDAKENGIRGSVVKTPAGFPSGARTSASGGMATSAAKAAAGAAVVEMSGFFLEGPSVPTKSGGSGGGGGSQGSGGSAEGNWNLPSARYAVPLGEVVLGRDSVRDSSPANSNKLRLGIDKREEGVSRSQATLKACAAEGRVLVTHKKGAVNGIRIVRWAGSAGIAATEKAARRANTAGAAKALRSGELLQAGRQSHLYPGDTLQLDGFRVPSSSTCSYVLHPLPPGWTAPLTRSGSLTSHPATSPRKTPASASKKAGAGAGAAAAAAAGSVGAGGAGAVAADRKMPVKTGAGADPQAKKASPEILSGGGGAVGRRSASPKSTGRAAASSRGAPGGMTPPRCPRPPRSSAAEKAHAAPTAAAATVEGASASPPEGKTSQASAGPVAARAATADTPASAVGTELKKVPPPASASVDEDTVKKRLRMSLASAGRSGSGASASGTETSSAPPPPPQQQQQPAEKTASLSTAGTSGRASPAEPSAASASVSVATKRPHVEVEAAEPEQAVADGKPSPQGGASPSTPDRLPVQGVADAEASLSSGSSKRPRRESAREPAGGAAVSPAAGGVGASGAGAGASGAALATEAAQIVSDRPSAEASASAAAVTPAAAVPTAGSTTQGSSQIETTPRDRAAQTMSADGGGDGKSGEGVGGPSWKMGDLVVLKARLSKGINKLGGVARVLEVFEDDSYLVKLSMGGKPTRVTSDLLFTYTPSPGRRSTSRRRDGGGPRGVDPSNGWVPSPSSSSSSPSSSCSSPPPSPLPTASPSPLRLRSRGRRGRSGGAATPNDKKSASPPRDGKAGSGAPKKRSGAAAPAAAAGGDAPVAAAAAARPGDRARVLYDDTDWYMSTVVAVHRGGGVTVRFDDGSEERVTLSPGDAETCPDDALVPTPTTTTSSSSSGGGSSTPSSSSRSRGARGSGSGRSSLGKSTRTAGRANGKAVRTLGPGGRVLREGEGAVLTEQRAKALLDTAPERLVGLVYQENHIGYGGWWETTVTEISEKRVGDGGGGGGGGDKNQDTTISKQWPESVKVGQMESSAEKEAAKAAAAAAAAAAAEEEEEADGNANDGNGNDGDDDDDGPDFVYTRKINVFLSRLRAWDKHREAEWEAELEAEGAGDDDDDDDDAIAVAKASSSSAKRGAKKDHLPASRPVAAPTQTTTKSSGNASSLRKPAAVSTASAAAPRRKAAPAKGASSAAGGSGTAAGGGGEKRKGGGNAAAPHPTPVVAKVVGEKSEGDGAAEEEERQEKEEKDKAAAAPKQTKATLKRQQLALKKEAAGERALPTCPFCRCEFYLTETQDQIDRHLASCGPRPAASAVVSTSTPMPPSLSSSLVIGLRGDDLGSLVAAVAELSARGLRPTVTLCDRAMQALYVSKCRFQTEFLRRLMKGTLAAFPECWRPLNWSRFEEALQDLVLGQDNLALNARTAYLEITLDCVQASRLRLRHEQQHEQHQQQQGTVPEEKDGDDGGGACVPELPRLPQLFLGAGGDLDGRSAVKRCSKWAAKIWARRYSPVASPATNGGGAEGFSAGTNARVCAVASRALGEALEAFAAAGADAAAAGVGVGVGVGGGGGGDGGEGSPVKLEGCRLAAVELESHGEVMVEAAAGGAGRGVSGGTQTAAGAVASAAARAATARCRAGLMRSLGARSFCPTLAGVLLENMPTQEDKGGGSDEVEGLKALLRRQQQQRATGAMSGGSAGGREGGQRVRRSRGEKAKTDASGSAMLFADMCHSGTDDL